MDGTLLYASIMADCEQAARHPLRYPLCLQFEPSHHVFEANSVGSISGLASCSYQSPGGKNDGCLGRTAFSFGVIVLRACEVSRGALATKRDLSSALRCGPSLLPHTRTKMTPCITNLDQLGEYDISLETAFVPEVVTASSLPPLFTLVEALVVDPPLADAIASSGLRSKVHDLPQYQRDDILNLDVAEQRRLFVILTFVAQGYVWGNGKDSVKPQLAEQIAAPLDYLGKILGITPLGTYASTVLWNSRLKDPVKGWILENVSIDFTFTGTEDESWFYKIRYGVAPSPNSMLTSHVLVYVLKLLGHEH